MAKPTNVVTRPQETAEEARASALETLLEGASDRSGALLETLALLEALHERGVLDAMVAFFQRGDDVLRLVVDRLDQPAYSDGIRNALTLTQSLAAFDQETLATTQRMVTGGIRAFASAQPPAKPLGVFDLLRALKDPDVSAGLTAALALLKGIGAAQRQRQEE